MASKKTPVIEYLFFERFDEQTGEITDAEVSLDDVVRAIDETGVDLSKRNPANFLKDIVRMPTRNQVFPESVVARGYTAQQHVGEGMCFQFVPLPEGQTEAFEDAVPPPDLLDAPHVIQSVSLPLPSRRLGRSDEAWLTQVAVRLALIHTHMALMSEIPVISVDLLQTNMKLAGAEIDAAFLASVAESESIITEVLLSCEMKSVTEVLEEEQMLRGAQALAASGAKMLKLEGVPVVPLGIKAVGGGSIWIIEYETEFPPLVKSSEAVYRFEPPVQGVG